MKKIVVIISILAIPLFAFAAWKVPDGYTVRVGRVLAVRSEIPGPTLARGPGGAIWGPENFGTGQMLALGFRPIRQESYDSENYNADATETDTGTEFVKGWENLTPKMSVNNRKKAFAVFVKTMGKGLIQAAKGWINDYYGEFDSSNPLKAEWEQYVVDLKAADKKIKGEVAAISDYDALIVYIKTGWQAHLPSEPGPE